MGPSGCGKTSLAKKLQEYRPETYKWLTQTTTRPPRDNEEEGREYYFLSDEQYDEYDKNNKLIAQVKEEFAPFRYGTPVDDLVQDKTNIIVASIEGFLDGIDKIYSLLKRQEEILDVVSVLFIKDVKPEVEREERNYTGEEKYNRIVLNKIRNIFEPFRIVEIDHNDLKKIRNNKELLLEFMEKNKL
jgi:guanylate kinase